MGEEGEGDGAAGAAVELGIDSMERLHLEGSEDMASGGSCDNTSKKLAEVPIGECPEPSLEVVESSTRKFDQKPESIQRGSSKNEEEKVAKISSKKEQKKVPRHRRFWESSDCSCSKEVLEEGDWEKGEKPREGSAGELKIRLEDVQGVSEQELRSNPVLSKHFLSRREDGEESENDDLIRVEFTVGCGTTAVDRRLEAALATFLEGERSRLTLRVFIEPKFNSRQGGEPLWLTVVATVQLVNLVQAEPMWRWFPETRLARAKEHYGAAVGLFKLSRWLDAFHLFQAAHRLAVLAIGVKEKEEKSGKEGDSKCLEDSSSNSNTSQSKSSGVGKKASRTLEASSLAEAWKLRTSCCNNLAACHFQWGNHASVVELSTVVLQADSNQVKALYRRGVSYLEMKEFVFAERDLVAAHKVEPSNRAVSEALGQVKLRKKKEQASMHAKMSKMFA